MEKKTQTYINTYKTAKILGTIWAIIFCLTYIFLLKQEKMLDNVAVIFHLCILFPVIILTSAITTEYKWCTIELFALYHTVVHVTQYWVCCNLMQFMFNHPAGYLPFLSEITAIIIILAYGFVVGAALTIPFKLLQHYYYDVQVYERDSSDSKTIKLELILESKNETELQALLKQYNADNEFEKSTIVRDILRRKFNV